MLNLFKKKKTNLIKEEQIVFCAFKERCIDKNKKCKRCEQNGLNKNKSYFASVG